MAAILKFSDVRELFTAKQKDGLAQCMHYNI